MNIDFKDVKAAMNVAYKIKLNLLSNFTTKELMDELRRRGKTISKKGVK